MKSNKSGNTLIEEKSNRAIKKCEEWLSYCLSVGWDKKDLDGLEKLFWKYRDAKTGELK